MVRDLGELGTSLQKIMVRLLSNQTLLKLLYYTDKDPYSKEDLTESQIKNEVYEKLIRVVPRVGSKETASSLVVMRVVRGTTNKQNAEFRDLTIQFEVFVPMTQWLIKDSNLRPFAIMGEIQKSLDNKVINGLGRLVSGGFALNFLTDEMTCYEMTFGMVEYD